MYRDVFLGFKCEHFFFIIKLVKNLQNKAVDKITI